MLGINNNMDSYLKESISNGNKFEQALIRKWWHEEHDAKGVMVWEYYLEGRYQDAVWFTNAAGAGIEKSGKNAPQLHSLNNQEVVLCEAKLELTPELIGQALVYKQFALHSGAIIKSCVIFSQTAKEQMINVTKELNLIPIVQNIV